MWLRVLACITVVNPDALKVKADLSEVVLKSCENW
jgi:hypothetical protein